MARPPAHRRKRDPLRKAIRGVLRRPSLPPCPDCGQPAPLGHQCEPREQT